MDKSKKKDFLLRSPFFLKLLGKIIVQHYHRGAVAFAMNLIPWSATKLLKKHALLKDLSRDMKYFDDVELVFQSDFFQTFWIFNMFTCSYSISWYLWPTQRWGFNLNILKIQNVWNSSDAFAFILPQQRPVLLMLRTSLAEVWQQKKTLKGNAPKTVTGVTKGCTWKI